MTLNDCNLFHRFELRKEWMLCKSVSPKILQCENVRSERKIFPSEVYGSCSFEELDDVYNIPASSNSLGQSLKLKLTDGSVDLGTEVPCLG